MSITSNRQIPYVGKRTGSLVAVRPTGTKKFPGGQTRRLWVFKCDCGDEIETTPFNVRRWKLQQCDSCSPRHAARNRLPQGESSFRTLFSTYQTRAKKLSVPWKLTKEQFRVLTSQNCHWCGEVPKQAKMGHAQSFGAYIYNGLDRLIGSLGYTEGNVVPSCGRCNVAKNDMTGKEFIQWLEKVGRHLALNIETKKYKLTT